MANGLFGRRVAAMRAGIIINGFIDFPHACLARSALGRLRRRRYRARDAKARLCPGRVFEGPGRQRETTRRMSGDLKWNKIFGAALGTAFVILVVQQASGLVYHSEAPEKMGYFVDAPEEAAGGEAAELAPDWGTVLPTADLAAGEAAFARCQACHDAHQGGADKIGPNLWG